MDTFESFRKDIGNSDNCAICRNPINEECIECQASYPLGLPVTCGVCIGTCQHCYHVHCISRWLKTRFVFRIESSAARLDFVSDFFSLFFFFLLCKSGCICMKKKRDIWCCNLYLSLCSTRFSFFFFVDLKSL